MPPAVWPQEEKAKAKEAEEAAAAKEAAAKEAAAKADKKKGAAAERRVRRLSSLGTAALGLMHTPHCPQWRPTCWVWVTGMHRTAV